MVWVVLIVANFKVSFHTIRGENRATDMIFLLEYFKFDSVFLISFKDLINK